MKLKTTTKILICVFIIGLALALYPKAADYWNKNYTTRAVVEYSNDLENLAEEETRQIWDRAFSYNEILYKSGALEAGVDYNDILNVSVNGMMGYIEIPKIDVTLSLFHGTSAAVLQDGVGHIDWSSFPTGGENTHCVLSGHRGLASAKLFSDLDQLREGDTFKLNILNETLTYEVDQIRTVLPNEISDLMIEPGKDLCTLVTCTPYGVNTHRLLVRGHRIANDEEDVRVMAEAVQIDELIVAPIVATPLLLILVLIVMFKKPEKKKKIEMI